MLVNPISFRLSSSIFWNSTWSLYKNYNYKYLFYSDLVFFEFFMFFFKKTINLKILDIYPSHIRLYRLNNKVIVNLYYHIAKEAYYFDEIDLIYKKSHKKIVKNKKNYVKNKSYIKNYIEKLYKKPYKKILHKNILKLKTNFKKQILKNKNKNKFNLILKKIKLNFKKIGSYKKICKISNSILAPYKKHKKFNFLYKINFLKFVFNQKLWIFNLYFYFLSKFFKLVNKKYFFKYLKKLELNIFKIGPNAITSNLISKYIISSFKNNYSIYETLRPVLVDLKERIKKKRLVGFKITISGRFKRVERATYWWKKDGELLTGTQLSRVDYSTSLHKTKYGVCTISIWLTLGLRGLNQVTAQYPLFYPFFFLFKKNYFILKRNKLFYKNLLKKDHMELYDLKYKYISGLIIYLMYKYLYVNILFRNLLIYKKKNKINKNISRIFLPQYCQYKIYFDDFLKRNYLKIVPYIQLKYLKRLNLRNSYKVSFLDKSNLINLKNFKYTIYLD